MRLGRIRVKVSSLRASRTASSCWRAKRRQSCAERSEASCPPNGRVYTEPTTVARERGGIRREQLPPCGGPAAVAVVAESNERASAFGR